MSSEIPPLPELQANQQSLLDSNTSKTPANCTRCGSLPDDILVLTCDHNLCLQCAAANLHREQLKGQHTFQTVVCDLCHIATVLDPKSAAELLTLYPQIQDSQEFMKSHQQHHFASQNQLKHMSSSNNYSSQNKGTASSIPASNPYARSMDLQQQNFTQVSKSFCKEHDEPISYFCFDCLCEPICPECVVHGSHKGHSVSTVRKAYPPIRQKIQEIIGTLSSHIGTLNDHQNKLANKKCQVNDITNNAQGIVKKSFQEIRQTLELKENELLSSLDRFNDETQREFESYIRIVNGKAQNIAATCEFVVQQLEKPDQVGLLNFYALNHSKILSTIQTDIPQIKSVPELTDFKYTLNPERLNQMIRQLQGIEIQMQRMTDLATNPHTLRLNTLNEPTPYTSNTSIPNKLDCQIDQNSNPSFLLNKPMPISELQKMNNPSKFGGMQKHQSIFQYAYRGNDPIAQPIPHQKQNMGMRPGNLSSRETNIKLEQKSQNRGKSMTSKFLKDDKSVNVSGSVPSSVKHKNEVDGKFYYRKLHQNN